MLLIVRLTPRRPMAWSASQTFRTPTTSAPSRSWPRPRRSGCPGGSAAAIATAAAPFGPVRLWHPLPSPSRRNRRGACTTLSIERVCTTRCAGLRGRGARPRDRCPGPALLLERPTDRRGSHRPRRRPGGGRTHRLRSAMGPWSECFLDAARHHRIPVSFVGEGAGRGRRVLGVRPSRTPASSRWHRTFGSRLASEPGERMARPLRPMGHQRRSWQSR